MTDTPGLQTCVLAPGIWSFATPGAHQPTEPGRGSLGPLRQVEVGHKGGSTSPEMSKTGCSLGGWEATAAQGACIGTLVAIWGRNSQPPQPEYQSANGVLETLRLRLQSPQALGAL